MEPVTVPLEHVTALLGHGALPLVGSTWSLPTCRYDMRCARLCAAPVGAGRVRPWCLGCARTDLALHAAPVGLAVLSWAGPPGSGPGVEP